MMDLPSEAPTATGRNHGLLALVAFLGLAAAAVPTSGALDQGSSSALATVLAAIAVAVPITAVLTVGSLRSPTLRRWFGVFERLFYVAAFAWLFLAEASLVLNAATAA